METTLLMSVKERVRLEMFGRVKRGELSVAKAAELLALSRRQARRIWRRYCLDGDKGLVHRLRGRPGNAADVELREAALALCRQSYADFGSVLASEYLARAGIHVRPQTLWRWRREAGDLPPTRRVSRHRIRRQRRGCIGELVQMDGSTHAWFEDRRGTCVLFVMVDDASGRVFCRFYESEDTTSAFDLFGRYARKHGLATALYVDKDSIYRVNAPQARQEGLQRGKEPLTQFGRAMKQLGVEVICANSPQAKGRVERANGTLQDRLVKALRVEGISTIDEANAFLERQFLREHNRRFARAASEAVDVHRKLPGGPAMGQILCVQETRKVGRDWCVQYEGRVLQLDKRHEKLALAGRLITVLKLASGQLRLLYRGQSLRWQELPMPAPPRAKSPLRSMSRSKAAVTVTPAAAAWRPAADHPWRSGFVKPAPLRGASLRSAPLRCAGLTKGGGDSLIEMLTSDTSIEIPHALPGYWLHCRLPATLSDP